MPTSDHKGQGSEDGREGIHLCMISPTEDLCMVGRLEVTLNPIWTVTILGSGDEALPGALKSTLSGWIGNCQT